MLYHHSIIPDEDKLNELIDLGFDKKKAEEALRKTVCFPLKYKPVAKTKVNILCSIQISQLNDMSGAVSSLYNDIAEDGWRIGNDPSNTKDQEKVNDQMSLNSFKIGDIKTATVMDESDSSSKLHSGGEGHKCARFSENKHKEKSLVSLYCVYCT